MSQLNDNTRFAVYNGESYILSVAAEACYGITAVNGKNGETNLTISGASANGPLNSDCYTSITASVPASGTVSGNLEYNVISRPLAYQVIYHQTGGTTATYDGGATKIYTDFDSRSITDVPRQNITVSSTTYAYSANCLSSLPNGWSEPTAKRFDGWSLSSSASTADIAPGDAFADEFDCSDVDSSTYVLNLYAHYADEDSYAVTIYFDSAEIDENNISLS